MNRNFSCKKIIYSIALIMSGLTLQRSALANCNFLSGQGLQSYTIKLNSPNVINDNILLARDKFNLGTAIAFGEEPNAVKGNYAICLGNNAYSYYVSGAQGTTVGGLSNVFPTNIPGVGIRFYLRDNTGKNYRFGNQGGGGTSNAIYWGWSLNGTTYWGAEIVPTGPISSGTYDGSLMAVFILDRLTVLNLRVAPFTISASSCSANTTQSIVNLDKYGKKDFIMPGSTSEKKHFSIELTGCSASGLSTIAYTLTPLNNIIDANQAVMGINTMKGAAKGVGVQILDQNGVPVRFNSVTNVPSFVPGSQSVTIPFQAAMYRTSLTPVTTGIVRSPLTFTMTYR
ncbi:fimbrial protein [Serratia fonticola]|uniref:fimbrial protein n=1 Tax=Serratia fonticola TaxID=47917 RepID=UPI0003AEF8F3|nr:fimbrial protein [Serratia fonticola]ERK05887.1 fimbrial protein [Serratia fonticola AU-AP2C]MBP1037074.1 type 1 fimbrial protein [Serratia fonticola]